MPLLRGPGQGGANSTGGGATPVTPCRLGHSPHSLSTSMPTGLGGWQRQCGEWAWAVTSQTSGMGQLAGEKAPLRVPTSCTPFPGSLPSLLVVSRAPGGPNCALPSAPTWTAGAGAGGAPGALIGPLRLRGPGQLQRSLWVLKGLPWSSRVPAVPRVQAWAAALLGLAGAWGRGTLLNAWSVVCGLESQIPADPQDGGLGCSALLYPGKCAP